MANMQQSSEEEEKGGSGRGRKDKGGNDGKQSRPKKIIIVGSGDVDTRMYVPWQDHLLEVRELLKDWKCAHEEKLRMSGIKVSPTSSLENEFSSENSDCRKCGRCRIIMESCGEMQGPWVARLVKEYSILHNKSV